MNKEILIFVGISVFIILIGIILVKSSDDTHPDVVLHQPQQQQDEVNFDAPLPQFENEPEQQYTEGETPISYSYDEEQTTPI